MDTYRCLCVFFLLIVATGLQLQGFAGDHILYSNFYSNHHHTCKNVFRTQVADTNSLRQAVIDFIAKADSGRVNDVINYYDPGFLSVRVVDAGQFIKMDYNQMVSFWKIIMGRQSVANGSNRKTITSTSTVIHYMEMIGDTGYVLMTRVKNFGSGPEPVFYNLIWVNKNSKWFLLREIVHQRTAPDFH